MNFDKELKTLKAKIASLEAELSEESPRETLAEEIASLESELEAGCGGSHDYMGDDDVIDFMDMDDVEEVVMDEPVMEEDMDHMKYMEEDHMEEDHMKYMEEDHMEEDHMDYMEEEYLASDREISKLKSASERLDKVAAYLEENGNVEAALRIDKVADAVDNKINELENK